MEISYYNLSGGINQALTKTELGSDTKKYTGRILKILKFCKIVELLSRKEIPNF